MSTVAVGDSNCPHGGARFTAGTDVAYACNGAPASRERPIIWSGGCSMHGQAAGWNRYCANAVEFNTAGAYLTVDPSGQFTILASGYYRLDVWTISNVLDVGSVRLLKNGSSFHYGYEHVGNQWSDQFADVIWPFNAADTLVVEVYNSGGSGFAYHSWSPSGTHGRLQIQYVGPL